jgi:hypothetical protein
MSDTGESRGSWGWGKGCEVVAGWSVEEFIQ